jgi:hypothetical protein
MSLESKVVDVNMLVEFVPGYGNADSRNDPQRKDDQRPHVFHHGPKLLSRKAALQLNSIPGDFSL